MGSESRSKTVEGVAFGEDAFSVMMGKSRRAIYSKKDDWKEDLSLRVDTGKTIRYDTGVEIRPGQHGIFIMWYEKIDINSDDLDYHVSRTDVVPTVQHNEYMVMQGFKMHRVIGQSNPVPRTRATTDASRRSQYARQRQNNTTSFQQWHDKEFGLTWKMDDEVKTEALAKCGMWR
jgi:hypothetical protein